ncbi:MAG: hypothetical protein RLY86_120 [Pseudomonadota bacterium]|jgi:P2 family phage contractile tail tube protein
MLPRKLYAFNVIIEGNPMAGVASEITLPVLDRKMEEFRAGGMLGPAMLDLGMEALSLSFTLAQFERTVLTQWGVFSASALNCRFLGAARADDGNGQVEAIEIQARGRWKQVDMGTAKAGDMTAMKIEMPLTYYKYTSDGQALVEIDLVAGREIVGGVDRSAAVLRAIGATS